MSPLLSDPRGPREQQGKERATEGRPGRSKPSDGKVCRTSLRTCDIEVIRCQAVITDNKITDRTVIWYIYNIYIYIYIYIESCCDAGEQHCYRQQWSLKTIKNSAQ